MSLFEDSSFQYRETYFVFFKSDAKPSAEQLKAMVDSFGRRYAVLKTHESEGNFEAITIVSEQDNAGIDVTLVEGDDVKEKVVEINEAFKSMTVSGDDLEKLGGVSGADTYLEVFHFEKFTFEEEMLDPGALLKILDGLVELTGGVAYDPQSTSFM